LHSVEFDLLKQLATGLSSGIRSGVALDKKKQYLHLRRHFYDIAKGAAAPLAEEALARIAALCALEARIRGQSPALGLAARRAEAAPLVTALNSWFEAPLARVSAKSVIAAAFRYGLNHGEGSPAISTTDASRSIPTPSSAACGRFEDRLPVHAFRTLLADLATLTRNTLVTAIDPERSFTLSARPTALQQKALDHHGLARTL